MEALLQQINEAFAGLLASIANGGAAGLHNDPFLNLEPILSKISESASALGISSGDVSKITGLVERATGALNTPETIAVATVLTYVVANAVITWGDWWRISRPARYWSRNGSTENALFVNKF